ncbi:hypothetical protein ACH4VR_29660 [Streptomyces sp. NPDC020883]
MYIDEGKTGTVRPTPEELAKDTELRNIFGDTPHNAVRALALYPMG